MFCSRDYQLTSRPRSLKISVLNTNNTSCSLAKNSPIATLIPAGKCKQVWEIKWPILQNTKWSAILEVSQDPQMKELLKKAQLLPEITSTTNLQLEPDMPNTTRSIPDADVPQEARNRLKELLNAKCTSLMSKSATHIGRTNFIELDILTEGPLIASKPYTVLLKYREFVDHEIKQLEEVGIISRIWAIGPAPYWWFPRKKTT